MAKKKTSKEKRDATGRGRVRKPRCDRCKKYDCSDGKDCFGRREEFMELLVKDALLFKAAKAAASVEAEHYCKATRIEEIAHFAEKAGFKRIGMAYCVGFKEEARIACGMLRTRFDVFSVCCKAGALPKAKLGFPNVKPDSEESSCNPIGQAEILNRAGTDLNIAVGLCVGHDALFSRQSDALVTTLVAKDRVLGHNPVAALYCPYVKGRLDEGLFAG